MQINKEALDYINALSCVAVIATKNLENNRRQLVATLRSGEEVELTEPIPAWNYPILPINELERTYGKEGFASNYAVLGDGLALVNRDFIKYEDIDFVPYKIDKRFVLTCVKLPNTDKVITLYEIPKPAKEKPDEAISIIPKNRDKARIFAAMHPELGIVVDDVFNDDEDPDTAPNNGQ